MWRDLDHTARLRPRPGSWDGIRLFPSACLENSSPRCPHELLPHFLQVSAQIFTLPESSSDHSIQNSNTTPSSNFPSFLAFQSTHHHLTVIVIGLFVLCSSFSTRL